MKPYEKKQSPDESVTLADFKPALKLLRKTQTPYCLVGGLAVGLWAEEFLTPEEKKSFEIPIRSKDIDIRAEKEVAIILQQHLRTEGAKTHIGFRRIPKDSAQSFPSYAAPVSLPKTPQNPAVETTIEALSGMPLLDEYEADHRIRHNGSVLLFKEIYLLDPCSLLVCKLNAINTRPAGESENDSRHATILSLVIPRFIEKTLARRSQGVDPYHPANDSSRLASFLNRDPWSDLIPSDEKSGILDACEKAKSDS